MISIQITPAMTTLSQNIVLGCVMGEVRVSPSCPLLLDCMGQESSKQQYPIDVIANLRRIKETRDFYNTAGKDPFRYRGSAEALLRRLAQGKGLYNVNNVVDINNILSIRSHFSVGSYDTAQLMPPLRFEIGEIGASYKGIGKGIINVEHLPVFADSRGPFGSPTSDSERAMIRSQTTDILMMVISFSGPDGVADTIETGRDWLLKFASGKSLMTVMIEGRTS